MADGDGDGRAMTAGEVAMLREVYGPRLPYAKVRVHARRWSWPFPKDRAMAPDGEMYFPGDGYAADFSAPSVDLARRSTFVHEAAHLYQWYVLRQIVWLRGPFSRTYDYELKPGKAWTDYGLEQMAMIAQDWWLLRHGGRPLNRTPYPLAAYAGLMPVR